MSKKFSYKLQTLQNQVANVNKELGNNYGCYSSNKIDNYYNYQYEPVEFDRHNVIDQIHKKEYNREMKKYLCQKQKMYSQNIKSPKILTKAKSQAIISNKTIKEIDSDYFSPYQMPSHNQEINKHIGVHGMRSSVDILLKHDVSKYVKARESPSLFLKSQIYNGESSTESELTTLTDAQIKTLEKLGIKYDPRRHKWDKRKKWFNFMGLNDGIGAAIKQKCGYQVMKPNADAINKNQKSNKQQDAIDEFIKD